MAVVYDLKPVRAVRLRGMTLRLATALLEKPAIASLAAPWLTRGVGLREFHAAEILDAPTFLPRYPAPGEPPDPAIRPADVPPRRGPGFRFHGIRDYHRAYLGGIVTPEQVAERVVAAIADSDRLPLPLRAFIAYRRDDILSQARQSSRRYKQGRPLGPLDGAPIAVKDELDMVPYATTAGTRFSEQARADATAVARLRSAGALLIGKTNMHEIGILPDALNPHHGPVRNPYGMSHEAGGSSSGSAAAVAAGLCPAALGADGGGSIRIPAAYCGVVGMKPTFGRVSEHGAVPLAWSVAHLGPLAATAEDAALVYAAVAGPDPADPNTQAQPPHEAAGYDGSLQGVRIGVFPKWFADASADIVAVCERLLGEFVRAGAEITEVAIPELRLAAVAHGLTIHSEMEANMRNHAARRFSHSTRLMLANVRSMRPGDYVRAQQVRTRAMGHFRSALSQADVIATPAVPITAPEIRGRAATLDEVDIGRAVEAMRFVNPANFTGLPAISIPAGYEPSGLPVGLQLIGRPWEESTLLRFAYAAEERVARQEPDVYFDLLPELRTAS